MTRPPYGISLPCTLVRVIDGDTAVIRLYDPGTKLAGILQHKIRLMDCWAPEVRGSDKARGIDSREYLIRLLTDADEPLSVFVPMQAGLRLDTLTTLGRWLGRLFLGQRDVSELMVEAGFASKTRPEGSK